MKNKRGDFTGLLYLVVMISATAFFLLIAGYISVELSTSMKETINATAPANSDEINAQFDATTNVANNSLTAVWFVVFGGLLLGLFITAWNIPTKPIYVPVFIILLIVTIIVAVVMSNAYEKLYEASALEDTANTQGAINFVMSNLPYASLIMGLIVLIITFAKPGVEQAPVM